MKTNLSKYLNNDLVKYLFLPICGLLIYCITNIYTHTISIKKLYEDRIIELDSTNNLLESLISLEQTSSEILKRAGNRNLIELKMFSFLSKKEINIDSLNGIPIWSSKFKLQIAEDQGRINKYSTLKIDFANQNTYHVFSDFLDLELQFIEQLDKYYQFKKKNKNAYDEPIFKQTESTSMSVYSKLNEIGNRLSPDDILKLRVNQQRQSDFQDKEFTSKVQEKEFLRNLLMIGTLFSALLVIILICISIKYKLFGVKR